LYIERTRAALAHDMPVKEEPITNPLCRNIPPMYIERIRAALAHDVKEEPMSYPLAGNITSFDVGLVGIRKG